MTAMWWRPILPHPRLTRGGKLRRVKAKTQARARYRCHQPWSLPGGAQKRGAAAFAREPSLCLVVRYSVVANRLKTGARALISDRPKSGREVPPLRQLQVI